MNALPICLLTAWAVPLFGGCALYLDLGNPEAASDARARNAFVTVRVFNCRGSSRPQGMIAFPAQETRVRATAEGRVDGKRMSVPLVVVRTSTPGLSAVHWTMPHEGLWLLNLHVLDAGPYYIGGRLQPLGVLAPVGPHGAERGAWLVGVRAGPDEIGAAFDELAAQRRAVAAAPSLH